MSKIKRRIKSKALAIKIDEGQTKIVLSPEAQEQWKNLAWTLYGWLRVRFEDPIEAFSFLHFAMETFEEYHQCKFTDMQTIEEHEA